MKAFRLIPFLFAAFLWAGVLPKAEADSVTAFAITNAGDYVIASDRNNASAGYDREGLGVNMTIRHEGSGNTTYNYRLVFTVRDNTGAQIPVVSETGSTGPGDYWLTTTVTMGPTSPFTGLGINPIDYALSLEPVPGNVLVRDRTYRVRVEIFRRLSGSSDPFVLRSTYNSPLRRYFHFASTNPTDAAVNVYSETVSATISRTHLVTTGATASLRSLPVSVAYRLHRYDDFERAVSSPSTAGISVRLNVTLRRSGSGTVIPLEQSLFTFSDSMNSFTTGSNPRTPRVRNFNRTLNLRPLQQLDPVNSTYNVEVRVDHVETPPSGLRTGDTLATASARILHFNGTLAFGDFEARLTNLSNDPTSGTVFTNRVNTQLQIPAGGAHLQGSSDFIFGNNILRNFQLYADGRAVYTGGNLTYPVTRTGSPALLDATRTRLELLGGTINGSGFFANLRAALPGGFSVAINSGSGPFPEGYAVRGPFLTFPQLPFEGVPLNPDFTPKAHVASTTLPVAGTTLAVDGLRASIGWNSIQWDTAEHRFTVQTDGVASYDNPFLAILNSYVTDFGMDPALAVREANYLYQRALSGVDPELLIDVEADGRGRLSAAFTLNASQFQPHFPRTNAPIQWSGGALVFDFGSINPAESFLNGVGDIRMVYARACEDGEDCPFGGDTSPPFDFQAESGLLRITPDGGLIARGTLATARELFWGAQGGEDFAHETEPLTESSFHMAGNFIRAGEADPSPVGPGRLLLSGWTRDLPMTAERPGTAAYLEGQADYAGLNFRASDHPPRLGASSLGGETALFSLGPRVKYYLRPAGISGIHEPAPGTFQAPPRIYGYDFEFDRFGLNFLDNANIDSVTDGSIELPFPANFTVAFESLTLTCLGELDEADVAEGQAMVTMEYWQADLDLLSLRFARNAADACATGVGFLTLGVETQPGAVSERISGVLGFRGLFVPSSEAPDGVARARGNLLTPADGIEGVTSRLHLPETLALDGPKEEKYKLNPVGYLYYNNYDYRDPAQTNGYATFPVGIKVPFFREMQVQVIADGRNPDTGLAGYHLAGGWPTKGWKIDGQYFFNFSEFDASHWGHPINELPLDVYRRQNTIQGENFRPRALQKWLGIIEFEYPLFFNPIVKAFNSPKAEESNFVLFELKHAVRYLSAENAELTFGFEFDGLPRINLANIAFDALDEGLGISKALTEAAQEGVRAGLTEGIDRLGDLLEDKLENALANILRPLLDEFIDPFYAELEVAYQTAVLSSADYPQLVANWGTLRAEVFAEYFHDESGGAVNGILIDLLASMESTFDPLGSGLNTVLREIDDAMGAIDNALRAIVADVYVDSHGKVIKFHPINAQQPLPYINDEGEVVTPVFTQLTQLKGILMKETTGPDTGKRQIIRRLVEFLLTEATDDPVIRGIGNALKGTAGELDKLFNELISDFDTPLEELTKAMVELRKAIKVIREVIREGRQIASQIEAVLAGARSELETVAARISEDIEFLFAEMDRVRPSHQRGMAVADLPSPFEEYPAHVLKARIEREIFDRVGSSAMIGELRKVLKRQFYQVDALVKEVVDTVFSKVGDLVKGLISSALSELESEINDMLGDVGSSVGSGKIEGYAHIHGDALRRLRLDGEFKLSVPSDMQFKAYLLIEQLNSDGPGGCGTGPGGEPLTEISLGAKDVKAEWLGEMIIDVGTKFTLAIGEDYAYPAGMAGSFALKGGGIDFEAFKIKELSAGVAFGVNENYLTAATRVEMSSYELAGGIFFGRTCTVDPIRLWDPDVAELLGTGPFTGAYVYGEGWIPISETILGVPATCMFRVSIGVGAGIFFFIEGPTYGGKLFGGVSGEVLCLISIRGEITMVGVKQGDDLRFSGKGKIAGSIGPCPVCLKLEVGFKAKYENDAWDIDL